MEIDAELQNLIDEYIKQVEAKEDDLVGLKRNIDGIISVSKRELENAVSDLDKNFDANKINEEEYLVKLRAEKKNILDKAKSKMDALVASYEKIYSV